MGKMRNTWRALALVLVGLQAACSGGGTGAGPDTDGDGVADIDDCAAESREQWRTLPAHRDGDGDGVGSGPAQSLCAGEAPPRGWALSAGDCDDSDATRWREMTGLYPDRDGDGWTAEGPVTGCVGASLSQSGYLTRAGPPDCDDTNRRFQQPALAWPDADGDGRGEGPGVSYCVGATPPPGYAALEGDCAPDDATRALDLPYAYRDSDGDGFAVAEVGTVCAAALPKGYLNVASALDCDDSDDSRWRLQDVYVDTDGDGFGAGAAELRCVGARAAPGSAWEGEDCGPDDGTRWQWRSYAHRDRDGDGATLPESGVLCAGAGLPEGYHVSPSGHDCDDTSAERLVSWSLFPDTDGDGVGAGTRETLCAGTQRPQGYSAVDTDCAASDATAWQRLAYSYRDGDGDGFTLSESGELCAGAALPSGYTTTSLGPDCDDLESTRHTSVQAWEDTDEDGVGAGDAVTLCTNGTVPSPWSATGTDCEAGDGTRWRVLSYSHVDGDADGHTRPERGTMCAGAALPAAYRVVASGNDCDDTAPSLFRWAVVYPDADGDGVGAAPRTVPCLGQNVPSGFSFKGYDVDDADASRQEDADEDLLVDLILSP